MKTVKEWLSQIDVSELADAYASDELIASCAIPKEKCRSWFQKTVEELLQVEAATSSDHIFVASPEYHEQGMFCVPRLYKMSELQEHIPGEPLSSYCWSLSPISEVLATPIAETPYMLRNQTAVIASIIEEAMEFSDTDEGKAEMVSYLQAMADEIESAITPEEELCVGLEEDAEPAPEVPTPKSWPEFEDEAAETFDKLCKNIYIAFDTMNTFCREQEFVKVKQVFETAEQR